MTRSLPGFFRHSGFEKSCIDYITKHFGLIQAASYDKEVLKRIDDFEQLDPDTKQHLFFLIDNVIQNFKTKKAFA